MECSYLQIQRLSWKITPSITKNKLLCINPILVDFLMIFLTFYISSILWIMISTLTFSRIMKLFNTWDLSLTPIIINVDRRYFTTSKTQINTCALFWFLFLWLSYTQITKTNPNIWIHVFRPRTSMKFLFRFRRFTCSPICQIAFHIWNRT